MAFEDTNIVVFWIRCGVVQDKSDGNSTRAVDLGDREEEQLLPRQAVRKRNRRRSVQQGEQQSLQSQLIQALW